VAFVLGMLFANEHVTGMEIMALAVILVGVFLVLSNPNKEL
jgi:drug/metabolite transporter (DMT)-like permease